MKFMNQKTRGDRISAREYNQIIGAVNTLGNIVTSGDIEATFENGAFSIITKDGGTIGLPCVVASGENGTGAKLDRFQIAAIDPGAMTTIDQTQVSDVPGIATKATEDGDVARWVIALEPIEASDIGLFAVGGICFAQVVCDDGNLAAGGNTIYLPYAEMQAEETELVLSYSGSARVLWEQTENIAGDRTSPHLALVQFGGQPTLYAEATSDVGDDGRLTVKLVTSDGDLVGQDVYVYDGSPPSGS